MLLLSIWAASAPDPVSFFVNYGVAGIVLGLFVTGQVKSKSEVVGLERQLEQARADSKEQAAAMAALVSQITQHTLPQLGQLADVLDRLPKATESHLEQRLAEMSSRLAALDKRPGGA